MVIYCEKLQISCTLFCVRILIKDWKWKTDHIGKQLQVSEDGKMEIKLKNKIFAKKIFYSQGSEFLNFSQKLKNTGPAASWRTAISENVIYANGEFFFLMREKIFQKFKIFWSYFVLFQTQEFMKFQLKLIILQIIQLELVLV